MHTQRRRRTSRAAVTGAAMLAATAALTLGPTALAPAAAASTAAAAPARTALDGAGIVSETWLDSRTVDLQINSPAIRGTVGTRLLLPADWSAQATRTWPVLYLLQGAHDDYTSWTRETDIEQFTADKEVIVAMPSSGPTGIPSTWWNFGSGAPDYETFQVTELMQLLQQNYRAGTTRAIGGVSTGGWGAIAFAARHPGTFKAAASYSGVLHTTMPGMPIIVEAIVGREGLLPWALWGSPIFQSPLWNAQNPYALASKLTGTSLYLSSGTGVVGGNGELSAEALETTLWPASQSFAARLQQLGIPVQTHFYLGGTHSWTYWRNEYKTSWPLLSQALGL
ncbi:esterase [Streptomyces sp. So13.3]|uniref:alpha/beta hydrolase n=1 Tax=Streptomyces TaxID=1883 RepID=UPI001106015B|nr:MULTISPECIES: alpha/beta hydrolase family protein [Streptomyces]MCZ4103102.1 alpha/beta hydrolase family protein [Streptomyces sp. H39-C1]QNA76577.1 esterase [Streptomyces sp. So13.3]